MLGTKTNYLFKLIVLVVLLPPEGGHPMGYG